MGIVYKARQHALNRTVALKMVLTGMTAKAEDLVRFLAEAETAAHLQHQGIVQILESGRTAGLPYFTMEYVDGGSLADRLRSGPLPPAEAAGVALALAEAVAHAHAAGVVHHDLKPANILLAADGTPKITDFGLARRLEAADGLTRTGTILGTPSYKPPRAGPGRPPRRRPGGRRVRPGCDPLRTACRPPPFRADNPVTILSLVLNTAPVKPRSVNVAIPRDLETVALKCLEKEPGKRYASAAALADDLRRFLGGWAILGRRASAVEKLRRWARWNPAVATLLGLVLVSLAAGTVVSSAFAVRAADNADRADANAGNWSGRRGGRRFTGGGRAERGRRTLPGRRPGPVGAAGRSPPGGTPTATEKRRPALRPRRGRTTWPDSAPGSGSPRRPMNHRLRVGNALGRLLPPDGFCPTTGRPLDADCDPTGERVVSLVGDNAARVWNAARAAPAYSPLQHGGRVTSAEFSTNGERIATSPRTARPGYGRRPPGSCCTRLRADGPVARPP